MKIDRHFHQGEYIDGKYCYENVFNFIRQTVKEQSPFNSCQ